MEEEQGSASPAQGTTQQDATLASVDPLVQRLGERQAPHALVSADRRQVLEQLQRNLDTTSNPPLSIWKLLLSLVQRTLPSDVRHLLYGSIARCITDLPISERQFQLSTGLQPLILSIGAVMGRGAAGRPSPAQPTLSSTRALNAGLKALHALLLALNDAKQPLGADDVRAILDVTMAAMTWGLDVAGSSVGGTAPAVPGRQLLAGSSRTSDAAPGRVKEWVFSGSMGSLGGGAALGASLQGVSSSGPLRKHGSQASLSSLMSSSSFGPGRSASSYRGSGGETSEAEVSDSQAGTEVRDGEKQAKRKLAQSTATARQNALAVLTTLGIGNGKALVPHWSRLLQQGPPSISVLWLIENDPSVSVRVAAAHTVEGILKYGAASGLLASAEERSGRLSAFTSLAATLGSIVVDIRTRMARILGGGAASAARAATAQPPALTEAVLKLCRTLVTGSSKARLRVSHSEALRDPVLRLCSSSEPAIAIAAYGLLSAFGMPAPLDSASKSKPEQHEAVLKSVLKVIREGSAAPEVLAEAWATLQSLAPDQSQQGISRNELISLAQRELASDSEALRAAALRLLPLALPGGATDVEWEEGQTSSLAPAFIDIIKTAVKDRAPAVRCTAAEAIAELIKRATSESSSLEGSLFRSNESSNGPGLVPALLAALWGLLQDAESAVRADAIRALGLVVQSIAPKGEDAEPETHPGRADPGPWAPQVLEFTSLALLGRDQGPQVAQGLCQDKVLLVRLRASWTLGNLCAAQERLGPLSTSSDDAWPLLLSSALTFASDDDRLASNGLRALGSLLHVASPDQLLASSTAVDGAVKVLCSSLLDAKASPKSRWNAASALGKALTNGHLDAMPSPGSAALWRGERRRCMCEALSSALLERTFKVVLTAASALRTPHDAAGYGGEASLEVVRGRARKSKEGLERLMGEATFREVQMHGKAVEGALERLVR